MRYRLLLALLMALTPTLATAVDLVRVVKSERRLYLLHQGLFPELKVRLL